MKRLLMVLFAPFALVGGALIGYYAHAIRVAPPADISVGLVMDYATQYPFLYVGVALVLLGYLVRRAVLRRYENAISTLRDEVEMTMKRASSADENLAHLRSRMEWVENVLTRAAQEQPENMLLEAPHDYTDNG